MTPQLQPQHIEALYAFTKAHFVPYYEIQTELVDHLASDIEAQWADNPKLSFEQALQVAFKKFGVFGFQDVVEKRTHSMHKLYNKLFWQCSKPYLIGAKSWMTLLVFGLMYGLFQGAFMLGDNYVYGLFAFIVLIFIALAMQQGYQRNKIRKKNPEAQRWLFHSIINSRMGTPSLTIGISIQFITRLAEHERWVDSVYILIVSVLFTILGGYLYLNQRPFVQAVYAYWSEHFKRQYPEAPELT